MYFGHRKTIVFHFTPSLVRITFQLLKVISKCDAIVEPLIKMVAFDTALKLI